MSDAPSEDGGERRGLAEADVRLDPFTVHLDFAGPVGPQIVGWYGYCDINPIEPPVAFDETVVDFERLEAFKEWAESFSGPREMHEGELPPEMEDQLMEVEPQFNLRNLGRVEKEADPENLEDLEHPLTELGMPPVEPVEMHGGVIFKETGAPFLYRYHKWTRWLINKAEWDFRFAKDRRDTKGGLWLFDPFEKAEREGREVTEPNEPDEPAFR